MAPDGTPDLVDRRAGWLLSAPWCIVLGLFWLYPFGYALVLSFVDVDIFAGHWRFVGVDHFRAVLGNPDFWRAFWHTMVFTFGTVPVTTALSIVAALALNRRIRGRMLFRAGIFMPTLTATVVMALVYVHMYGQGGYLHRLAEMIGLPVPRQGFLLSDATALPAVMVMDIWISIGYFALLFLAGLQHIPGELYEDALLHGAGAWRRFWSITWPYLRPTLLYAIVINLIKSFQVFTEIFVMTQGGPLGSTTTAVYHVYQSGFERFNLGYASAAAFVLFVAIAIFSAIQFRLFSFGRGPEE
ncbi:MAG TPA: sugar ABC transporter permease [candidate division Zixibacteria bacterium]|jgi:multiple sugar transport system permease protein